MLKLKECEMCKQFKEHLIGGRLCKFCYNDAPDWIKQLVDNRKSKNSLEYCTEEEEQV